jgi:tRNA nucleotidyltransferase/poly(A) polymerase
MRLPLNHDIFRIVSEIVTEKDLQCYVIGGYVRDLLQKEHQRILLLLWEVVLIWQDRS